MSQQGFEDNITAYFLGLESLEGSLQDSKITISGEALHVRAYKQGNYDAEQIIWGIAKWRS